MPNRCCCGAKMADLEPGGLELGVRWVGIRRRSRSVVTSEREACRMRADSFGAFRCFFSGSWTACVSRPDEILFPGLERRKPATT